MLKLLVCYAHLLATCVALGSVLMTDWKLYQSRHHSLRPGAVFRLRTTVRVVLISLIALWMTGLTLVWLGFSADPDHYFANEKLWAKFSVVIVLTLNGVSLHRFVFPRLTRGTVLMELPLSQRAGFAVVGAVSTVSWLFAALLGVARPWNFSAAYWDVIGGYVTIVTIAIAGALTCCSIPLKTGESPKRTVLPKEPRELSTPEVSLK